MRIDERLEGYDDWEKETVLMELMSGWCDKQFTSGVGRVQESERLKVISALESGCCGERPQSSELITC